MITRTERQKICLKRWIQAGGNATVVAATGFGKTRMAINLIEAFVKRNENSSSLVIVPTQILKDQWIDQLEERGLESNARVEIINSAIKLKYYFFTNISMCWLSKHSLFNWNTWKTWW